MNSRPPPCEGDALPAELLPLMDATTRRSEVCMPFICRGQVFFANRPSVVRERRACYPWHARAGHLRSWLWQTEGHACTSDRQDGAPCPPLSPVVSKAFSPCHAGRRAPAFPERLWKSRPLRSRLAYQRPDRQGIVAILGPCPPVGNLHATLDNARDIPGSPPSVHPLKKIGRAAPVGLGYREKKRYRSPLVSL